jgi:hypothetical protein
MTEAIRSRLAAIGLAQSAELLRYGRIVPPLGCARAAVAVALLADPHVEARGKFLQNRRKLPRRAQARDG